MEAWPSESRWGGMKNIVHKMRAGVLYELPVTGLQSPKMMNDVEALAVADAMVEMSCESRPRADRIANKDSGGYNGHRQSVDLVNMRLWGKRMIAGGRRL